VMPYAFEMAPGMDHTVISTARPFHAFRLTETQPVVHLPHRVSRAGWSERTVFPNAAVSPLGNLEGRVFVSGGAELAGGVAAITTHVPPVSGQPVRLSWRALDEIGSYTNNVQFRAPSELYTRSYSSYPIWRPIVTTRRGALFQIDISTSWQTTHDDFRTESFSKYFWITNHRTVAIPLRADQHIMGSVALEDGGAIVLFRTSFPDHMCTHSVENLQPVMFDLVHLSPEGAVLQRRVTHGIEGTHDFVGLARLNGSWGIALASHHEDQTLQLLAFDGPEQSLGRWHYEGTPRLCGQHNPLASRLVLSGIISDHHDTSNMRVQTGLSIKHEGLVDVTAGEEVYERDSQGVCLRAIAASAQGERDYSDSPYGTSSRELLQLYATNGELAGRYDNGRSIAPIRATLTATPTYHL
jgi:hypothetical protein